jgi:hypothetical protein
MVVGTADLKEDMTFLLFSGKGVWGLLGGHILVCLNNRI